METNNKLTEIQKHAVILREETSRIIGQILSININERNIGNDVMTDIKNRCAEIIKRAVYIAKELEDKKWK